jgi:hypothetical protein
MKIHELITELQKLDPNLEVLIAKDAEGNGFSKLETIDSGGHHFDPEDTDQIWHDDDQDDDCADGDECKAPPDAVPCIILWP